MQLDIQTPRAFVPLLQPARYKGAHGGRASAKSHFFAELHVEESISQKIEMVCLREHQKSLQFSVKKLIESKIEKFGVNDYFDVQDKRILHKTGGVTIFEGMKEHTSDSIKSLEGFNRSWFEEAQRASSRSIELLRPTMRAPDTSMWFSWNPEYETDPVDVLLRGPEPPPDTIVVEANYTDNPWFPEQLRAELEWDRRRDPDKFSHVWMGGYQRNSSSRVFRNWTIEEFDIPDGVTIRQGADWGFSIDPTVLVQCYTVGRKLYIPYEAYRVGCEITETPDLFMSVPDAEKWPLVADSSRPETISHLRRNGFPKIEAAIKGARSVEEGIEFLKTFDIVVHPRCQHTIDELTMYSYKVDDLTGAVLPVLADKDNHVIDALRYSCEGARRAMANVSKPVNIRTRMIGGSGGVPAGWMG